MQILFWKVKHQFMEHDAMGKGHRSLLFTRKTKKFELMTADKK
jgi:hypothetical protein